MDTLVAQLRVQLVQALNLQDVKAEQIDPAAPLFGAGLGLDSLDALEIVVMLERHYGIRITDAEVGKQAFASVNALADFIRVSRASCQQS